MNNSWKDCWQGFLKPLPVLKQIWQKIFIDFVVDLLSSEGCMNLLIITDCLSKKVILKLCKNMTAEWVTQTFVQHFYELMSFYHNSLRLRHSVCEQPMKESLSTFEDCMKNVHSISLKTDRATEQMNQNVELYICMFFNYSQNNWASLLLMTELVINNHDFISTEWASSSCLMSITWSLYNYLRSWSLYDLQKFSTESWSNCTKDERSHRVSTDDYDCHSADTERNDESKRQQSYDFKKEDKIWLNLKNIHTDCLCKKFDAKNVKYIIVKKISSHFFCLNTLLSIHNVFHSVMLQSAVMNSFFSVYDRLTTFITNCKWWRRVWDKEDSEEEICMT
jgi:hypothetical protein